MKNKPQNHSAANPQGGAAAHSDIIPPIVPDEESPLASGMAPARAAE